MNYHDIKKDDMLNGSGIRTTLFVSGCTHNCHNCHNPQTHDFGSGIPFDKDAINEIITELEKDYISGLTLSGGDPLSKYNTRDVYKICAISISKFPNKGIWCYTGYTFEELLHRMESEPYLRDILNVIEVLVDGRFVEELKDVNLPYAGSLNQRVIDVKESLKKGEVVLWSGKRKTKYAK